MVKRDVDKQRIIFAGIITLIIFCLGIALGVIVDYERLYRSERTNEDLELNYRSLQLQYLFLAQLDDEQDACMILRAALQNSIEELGYSLEEYERYRQDTYLDDMRYATLQRKYLQDNLRYWLFSSQLQEQCETEVINILYFYSDKDCPICVNQGTVLSYFKTKLDDKLLVFPINIDLKKDEQFLELLMLAYNVTELPTIIVNEERHVGVIGRQELAHIICSHTENKETCLL